MPNWGKLALVLVGTAALVAATQAQQPVSGRSGLRFVPIDTTKNLAAPIPLMPQAPKKSFLERTSDRLSSLNPFSSKKSAPSLSPMPPQARLPKNMQAPPQQQPSSGGLSNLKLPEIPPLLTGVAR